MTDETIALSNPGQVSDGYHTFDDLYEHRNLLFMNLCLTQVNRCCWNRNGDIEGYFCLYLISKNKQISYHIPNKYLSLIEDKIKFKEIKWDGHTSANVVQRLESMIVFP